MAPSPLRPNWHRFFTIKPLQVVHAEETAHVLARTLNLWDLVAIGVGGTVGSGVFVVCGLIAGDIAGPASILSWIIAGTGCLLSGLAFAELSYLIPSAGGVYAYTYVAIGELPAVIVGWCLTLEYGISGCAIARNWGDKVELWLGNMGYGETNFEILGANIFAAVLMSVCVCIVLCGADASKHVVNAFCIAKLVLVTFMIITALSLCKKENYVPWAPNGAAGVFEGAIGAFFGYLGYDEVTLLSIEAINPHRNVPLSLVISILITTFIYCIAGLSLSGVLPYMQLDPDSGFSEAFRARGLLWAYDITAVGEIVTLPLVVLVSFIAQPRLQYALAEDGLLPKMFGQVNRHGTLFKGGLFAGFVCIIISAWVPFSYLSDMISAGVLLAFNAANSSLMVIRRRPGGLVGMTSSTPGPFNFNVEVQDTDVRSAWRAADDRRGFSATGSKVVEGQSRILQHVASINIYGLITAVLWAHSASGWWAIAGALISSLAFMTSVTKFDIKYPADLSAPQGMNYFRVPFVPYLPSIAILVNWFIVAQLSWGGGLSLFIYLGVAVTHYLWWGAYNSVGNHSGWMQLLDRHSISTSLLVDNSNHSAHSSTCSIGDIPNSTMNANSNGGPGRSRKFDAGLHSEVGDANVHNISSTHGNNTVLV